MFKEIGTSKFYCCFDFCEFNPNQVSLYIHRNFFARALLDFPTNPLRSPFAPSFLAAYRSATQLLKTLRENFDAFSYLFIRLWPIWAHALAASVSTRLFCIWRSMSRKCTGDRWVRRLKWSFNNSGFFGVYRIGRWPLRSSRRRRCTPLSNRVLYVSLCEWHPASKVAFCSLYYCVFVTTHSKRYMKTAQRERASPLLIRLEYRR